MCIHLLKNLEKVNRHKVLDSCGLKTLKISRDLEILVDCMVEIQWKYPFVSLFSNERSEYMYISFTH